MLRLGVFAVRAQYPRAGRGYVDGASAVVRELDYLVPRRRGRDNDGVLRADVVGEAHRDVVVRVVVAGRHHVDDARLAERLHRLGSRLAQYGRLPRVVRRDYVDAALLKLEQVVVCVHNGGGEAVAVAEYLRREDFDVLRGSRDAGDAFAVVCFGGYYARDVRAVAVSVQRVEIRFAFFFLRAVPAVALVSVAAPVPHPCFKVGVPVVHALVDNRDDNVVPAGGRGFAPRAFCVKAGLASLGARAVYFVRVSPLLGQPGVVRQSRRVDFVIRLGVFYRRFVRRRG